MDEQQQQQHNLTMGKFFRTLYCLLPVLQTVAGSSQAPKIVVFNFGTQKLDRHNSCCKDTKIQVKETILHA